MACLRSSWRRWRSGIDPGQGSSDKGVQHHVAVLGCGPRQQQVRQQAGAAAGSGPAARAMRSSSGCWPSALLAGGCGSGRAWPSGRTAVGMNQEWARCLAAISCHRDTVASVCVRSRRRGMPHSCRAKQSVTLRRSHLIHSSNVTLVKLLSAHGAVTTLA
jgi:hypothetical protein